MLAVGIANMIILSDVKNSLAEQSDYLAIQAENEADLLNSEELLDETDNISEESIFVLPETGSIICLNKSYRVVTSYTVSSKRFLELHT
jgi:hypothetical protein